MRLGFRWDVVRPKAGRRRQPRAVMAVESLEERQVLSQMMMGPYHLPPMMTSPSSPSSTMSLNQSGTGGVMTSLVGDGSSSPQGLGQVASSGIALKFPHFYEFYVGPRRAELNVVAASGILKPGQGLVLTGVMLGRIDRHPVDANHSSFYVFGINRGSPAAIAPFLNRPGVRFDAVVVVKVEPKGISGMVVDLTAPKGTPPTTLDPRAIHVSGHVVRVTVNPDLLPMPAGGVSLSHYSFNLWPRSSLAMGNPPDQSLVASFIPENAMVPIRVPRGTP